MGARLRTETDRDRTELRSRLIQPRPGGPNHVVGGWSRSRLIGGSELIEPLPGQCPLCGASSAAPGFQGHAMHCLLDREPSDA